jgi:hypothetical protein
LVGDCWNLVYLVVHTRLRIQGIVHSLAMER